MFGYHDISINFLTDSPLITAVSLVLLILMAVYLYRRTNPPLPLYLRVTLSVLRIIAVVALVTALAQPVISYARFFERPKSVTVLIDKSKSMDRSESGKARSERLDSLLKSPDYERIADNAEISTYFFGGTLSQSSQDIDADKTALGDIIDRLYAGQMSSPADYWLILSDGNSNSGQDPRRAASKVNIPLYAVDLAADTGRYDIGIDEIDYNPVLFVGQSTEFDVKLRWSNAPAGNTVVQLLDSNRVAAQANLRIDQSEGFAETKLSYLPESPGQKILTVNVPTDELEESPGNNRRSFSVKVLKSRLMVLLVTKHPDYEVGFLKRLLDRSDKYDIDLAATGTKAGNLSAGFPSRQTELNRYDLVVLHDPEPRELESKKDLLNSYLSEKGGAIWVLMGERFADRGPVQWFNELLPFYQTRRRSIEHYSFHGEPSEGHLFHPAVRLAENPTAIRKAWAELPPLQALVRCDSIQPGSVVLATAATAGGRAGGPPILGYRRFGPGKLLASAAQPFWPWGFVSLGFGEDHTKYDKFIEGAISWLTVSDDLQPVRINPGKEVFHRGEAIWFDGFAFDLGFRPIEGAGGTITLRASDENRSYEVDLVDNGNGVFKAWFHNVTPGKYEYTGLIEKGGRLLKEEKGTILIETYSLEELDQAGDPSTLMAISDISGGKYFTYDRFDRSVNSMDFSRVEVRQQGEITLMGQPLLLMLFIAAICLEWLFRKINQLL